MLLIETSEFVQMKITPSKNVSSSTTPAQLRPELRGRTFTSIYLYTPQTLPVLALSPYLGQLNWRWSRPLAFRTRPAAAYSRAPGRATPSGTTLGHTGDTASGVMTHGFRTSGVQRRKKAEGDPLMMPLVHFGPAEGKEGGVQGLRGSAWPADCWP